MELKNTYTKLEDKELLLRHQLNTAYYWQEKAGHESSKTGDEQTPDKPNSLPEKWSLLNNIDLHDWQTDCKKKWFEAECRGVVKVVTGAGKTVLALAIVQELQNTRVPDLRVAVVVPTIVLMGQWYEALIRHGNLPAEFIGRMGGGFQDDFSNNKRILICVLDSASTQLAKKTAKLNIEKSLFLIVDECHRAGASKTSNVFSVQRAYSLGLSATPERNDSPDPEDTDAEEKESEYQFEDTVIGQELGSIVYELNFAQAIERGILPKFEIRHYGLPLQAQEKGIYENLSKKISELREMLQEKAKHLNGGALVGWARKVAARGTQQFSNQAGEYVRLTTQRKQMLYHARSREDAVIKILQKEFDENSETRAILFHESVDEVMHLFQILRMKGFPVVAENSKLTDSIRAESIELFRKGIARVLVSAKSLIEGFDVPAADVGIVVASSSSVRQRIQTLGRILRKKDEGKKNAVLHVLYMAHTTDEFIYEKNDWEDVVGADKNLYYIWDPAVDKEPAPKTEPPRRPLPKEIQIDLTALKPGDIYPGGYEGEEYSCDSKGNLFDSQRRIISNPQDVGEKVRSIKGDFGKFRVTPIKRAVLVLVKEENLWITRFVGILEHPFELSEDKETDGKIDVSSLKPGDIYPGSLKEVEKYGLKQRSGRIFIAKKVKGGERYACVGEKAGDPIKGKDAENLIAAVNEACKKEKDRISKFSVNRFNHAIYFAESKSRFLCVLEKGFEFPKEKGEG